MEGSASARRTARKYDLAWREAEEAALRRFQATLWLEFFVGPLGISRQPSEREFISCLRNGLVLCYLMNKVLPGSVGLVSKVVQISTLPAYRYFENISNFLAAVEDLKLPAFERSLFERDDMEVGSSKKVVDCILGLKAYVEWKEKTGGVGVYKPPGTPIFLTPKREGFQARAPERLNMSRQSSALWNGNVNQFSRIFSREQVQNKFPEQNLDPSHPLKEISCSEDNSACIPLQHNCKNLKVLLSSTKREFEDLHLKQLGVEMSTAALGYLRVMKEKRTLYNTVQDLKVVVDPLKCWKNGRKIFMFNRVFCPTATQEDVFRDTKPVIRSVMDGYNECIFAYGQTGSGKRYTMAVPGGGSTMEFGINLLALNNLFFLSDERKDMMSYKMVEIYNKQIHDLLASDASFTELEIRSCMSGNLTLLLQNSLGGHAKTLMFAHVSPEGDSFGETISTLKFAQRVPSVEPGAARSNKESTEVLELKAECCGACIKKGKCNHWSLVMMQKKELSNLKVLLSSMKREFEYLQSQLQTDLKQLGDQVVEMSTAALGCHRVRKENRTLYNTVQDLKGNIKVYCRIRPAFCAEAKSIVDFIGEDGSLVVVDPLKCGKDGRKIFQFNRVFGSTATLEYVFRDTKPVIRSVMDGYNVCIFSYGQSGSGKTHTMSGPGGGSTMEFGIHLLALNELFFLSDERKDTMSYKFHVQMVEIYNEQIHDLLASDASFTKLKIRSNGLPLLDASIRSVNCAADVMNLMKLGDLNRAVASTATNNRTSRSHSVLTVHVHGEDTCGNTIHSYLHLVDLAASEYVYKSEVTGDYLKEAQHINKSLSFLGDVITALAEKNSHIPYRNSKLTFLLQNSLGGLAKTLMFAHVSPEEDSFSETISTLKFAQRVSSVELGAARSNKESTEVLELKAEIEIPKKVLASKETETPQIRKPKIAARTPVQKSTTRARRLSIENCTTVRTDDERVPKSPAVKTCSGILRLANRNLEQAGHGIRTTSAFQSQQRPSQSTTSGFKSKLPPRGPTSASISQLPPRSPTSAFQIQQSSRSTTSGFKSKLPPRSPTSASISHLPRRSLTSAFQIQQPSQSATSGFKSKLPPRSPTSASISQLPPRSPTSTFQIQQPSRSTTSVFKSQLPPRGPTSASISQLPPRSPTSRFNRQQPPGCSTSAFNGSGKKNQQKKTLSRLNGHNEKTALDERMMRRRSLTGIQPPTMSRGVTLPDPCSKTTPSRASAKLTKRWRL